MWESNPGLLHCKWILNQLSYQGSPPLNQIIETRILGEVEKKSFIALPGKGVTQSACVLKTVYLTWEDLVRSLLQCFKDGVDRFRVCAG